MNLDRAYSLSPQVTIRPERFGGLVYRYDTCKLYFLHSPMLVELLTEMDATQPLREVLQAFVAGRGLGADDRQALETVLAQLEKMGILHAVGGRKRQHGNHQVCSSRDHIWPGGS